MKVGELARRTGVSVRTLHYYDEIGLLSPSLHNEAGHRLYGSREVARLQQILSLRQLGFGLEEIQRILQSQSISARRVIEMHLTRVREQMALQEQLCQRLDSLADAMSSTEVSVQQFIQTIEVMNMAEKYYTREQVTELKQRNEALGPEGMRQLEQEWTSLVSEIRAEMERGTDPLSETVRALARRSQAVIDRFTGCNSELENLMLNASRIYIANQINQKTPKPDIIGFLQPAMEALKRQTDSAGA